MRLMQEKQSYKIKTKDGAIYNKTKAHLKPYTPQKQDGPTNDTINGTIRPQVTNGTTDGTTRLQSTTSNNKQTQKGY